MMKLVGGIDSTLASVGMAYASGQEPRLGDVVQYPGTSKYPESRTGRVERIIPNGSQYRTPNKIRIHRSYEQGRPPGANHADKVDPSVVTLLHCRGCEADGTRMIPDSGGGAEWDVCPRCGRVEDGGPDPAELREKAAEKYRQVTDALFAGDRETARHRGYEARSLEKKADELEKRLADNMDDIAF